MIDTTKRWLSSNFEMKDMGEASYVLGVKIIRDCTKRILGLTQETYFKKMLERYHMQDSKLMDTLVDKSLSLSRDMHPKTLKEKRKCPEYFMPVSLVVWCMQWYAHVLIYVMSLDWLADINKTLVKNTTWQSKRFYDIWKELQITCYVTKER